MEVHKSIQEIEKNLEIVKSFVDNYPKSQANLQLSWVLKHIAYLEYRLQNILNNPKRNKSYRTECLHAFEHMREMRHTLDIWQTHGVPPDDYEIKELRGSYDFHAKAEIK